MTMSRDDPDDRRHHVHEARRHDDVEIRPVAFRDRYDRCSSFQFFPAVFLLFLFLFRFLFRFRRLCYCVVMIINDSLAYASCSLWMSDKVQRCHNPYTNTPSNLISYYLLHTTDLNHAGYLGMSAASARNSTPTWTGLFPNAASAALDPQIRQPCNPNNNIINTLYSSNGPHRPTAPPPHNVAMHPA